MSYRFPLCSLLLTLCSRLTFRTNTERHWHWQLLSHLLPMWQKMASSCPPGSSLSVPLWAPHLKFYAFPQSPIVICLFLFRRMINYVNYKVDPNSRMDMLTSALDVMAFGVTPPPTRPRPLGRCPPFEFWDCSRTDSHTYRDPGHTCSRARRVYSLNSLINCNTLPCPLFGGICHGSAPWSGTQEPSSTPNPTYFGVPHFQ